MKLNQNISLQKSLFFVLFLSVFSLRAQEYSLEQCKEMALKNASEISIAKKQVMLAETEIQSARANKSPSVNADMMAVSFLEKPNELFPDALMQNALNASVPIYAGGKIKYGIEASLIGKEIAQQNIVLKENEVIFRTEELYWSAIKLQEQIKLSGIQKTALEKLESELKVTVEAGLAQKNDLLKVQLGVNEVKLRQEVLTKQLKIVKASLQQHIGQEYSDNFNLQTEQMSHLTENLAYETAVNSALAQRPELTVLQKQKTLEQKVLQISDANFKPQIGLDLAGTWLLSQEVSTILPLEPEPSNFVFLEQNTFVVAPILSLSIPIYHGGKRRLHHQKHQINLQIKEAELRDAQEKITVEVRNAITEVEVAQETIKVHQLSVTQAEENLRLVKNQFEAGLVKGSEVLDAQFLWENAKVNVINAQIDVEVKMAQLRRVLGEK